ncbi:hypothetical protein TI39_contig4202g00059 [Zymoseptoria brevis]|uniref:Uncharacterized protein n=1 Tax=Zymoseptoria brevis TaxID=1047168 RepID=A0A0F4GDR0_9PEZI|nr:hypothetical protein TI39_contig4202g00059 [Zymoseptoria brevis]
MAAATASPVPNPIRRSEPNLPDDLLLDILDCSLPETLKIAFSYGGAQQTTLAIVGTNVSEWRATRGLLDLTPQMAELTGRNSLSKFSASQTTLDLYFKNHANPAASQCSIPDSILGKFSRIRINMPLCLLDPGNHRVLAMLKIEFTRETSGAWLQTHTKWMSISGAATAHPSLVWTQYHFEGIIGGAINYIVSLPANITAASLWRIRWVLVSVLRDLPPNNVQIFWPLFGLWRFIELNGAIRHHEEFWVKERRRIKIKSIMLVVHMALLVAALSVFLLLVLYGTWKRSL